MSSAPASDRYVWIWLPGHVDPTLCGHLAWDGKAAAFAYVRSYLERADSISVTPDWPITTPLGQRLYPHEDDALPGVIADVAPGRWAEYVLEKIAGHRLSPMERLIRGFGDRTGALEFSQRPNEPPEPEPPFASLEVVWLAVEQLERGKPVDDRLRRLFVHGTSLGGRRPKATVMHEGRSWVAKFGSVNDRDRLQPRREAFGLELARRCAIDVPDFKVVEVHGHPVLLVARFDRNTGGARRHVLSVRTLLRLSERRMLDSASYPAIGRLLRMHSSSTEAAARWYLRMVFNIVLGNTDDHALNHLFGWNGEALSMIPAFDLEPQPATEPRTQEMIVGSRGREGSLENALSAAGEFGLTRAQALAHVRTLVTVCRNTCNAALTSAGIKDRSARDELRRTLDLQLPR